MFANLSGLDIGILAAIVVVAFAVDFVAGIVGAKWGGAHWSSILWGLAGLVIGTFIFPAPLIGSVLGMFLGTLASELYRTKDLRHANRAATGSFLGWLAGMGFKLGAAFVFVILLIVFMIF